MQMFLKADFDRLAAMIPNTPENNAVYQRVMAMSAENAVDCQPYSFEVDFATGVVQGSTNVFPAPAAVGGVSIGNFLVDTSAPFMLVSSQFSADLAGAAVQVGTRQSPNWVITIQDQSSNRNWMNGPVPVPSIFGDARLPYFWPQPRLLPGNTNVQMTVTNYDAAAVLNVRLTFSGYRLYSA